MTVAFTTPITGAAQTGLTSPTYTFVADFAPTLNGKQVAVTALGGTQTGVEPSSVAKPFTLSVFKPLTYKKLKVDGSGKVVSVPKNTHKIITRKGVVVNSAGLTDVMVVYITVDVPAGAEQYDPASVRACLSLAGGAFAQQSAGLGDTVITGTL